MNKKTKNDLFPLVVDGITYLEKDCDELFVAFYNDKHSLNDEGGVYVSDGMWVYPDGRFEEY
jgi:hypothetical protein